VIGADLDAEPTPAEVYVVWEDLLAVPGPRYSLKRFARRTRWRRRSALDLYTTNGRAVGVLWDLWAQGRPVTVVTYLPPAIAAHLPARLEHDNVPHTRFLVDTPLLMSRSIALLDGVGRIFHSNPTHNLLYGPKGFLVPPQSPELMREVL
jgi:hypothetical protein